MDEQEPERESDPTDDWRYLMMLAVGMGLAMLAARSLSFDTGNLFVAFATVGVGTVIGVGLWRSIEAFGQARARRHG